MKPAYVRSWHVWAYRWHMCEAGMCAKLACVPSPPILHIYPHAARDTRGIYMGNLRESACTCGRPAVREEPIMQ